MQAQPFSNIEKFDVLPSGFDNKAHAELKAVTTQFTPEDINNSREPPHPNARRASKMTVQNAVNADAVAIKVWGQIFTLMESSDISPHQTLKRHAVRNALMGSRMFLCHLSQSFFPSRQYRHSL